MVYIAIQSARFNYFLRMDTYPNLNGVVAKILRERRERLGMSKRQLSTLASIERSYITGLENGRWNVSLNVLFYLCEALEIDPQEFIGQVKQELEKKNGRKWPFLE